MAQIAEKDSPMCIHCLKQIRKCDCKLEGWPGVLRAEVRRSHQAGGEAVSAGFELLGRLPCTKDGKPILWGDTVYITNPDGAPWEDGYVLPVKVESIMIGCHFKEYDGTHTIMGDDNECGNLECYSASELVPDEF